MKTTMLVLCWETAKPAMKRLLIPALTFATFAMQTIGANGDSFTNQPTDTVWSKKWPNVDSPVLNYDDRTLGCTTLDDIPTPPIQGYAFFDVRTGAKLAWIQTNSRGNICFTRDSAHVIINCNGRMQLRQLSDFSVVRTFEDDLFLDTRYDLSRDCALSVTGEILTAAAIETHINGKRRDTVTFWNVTSGQITQKICLSDSPNLEIVDVYDAILNDRDNILYVLAFGYYIDSVGVRGVMPIEWLALDLLSLKVVKRFGKIEAMTLSDDMKVLAVTDRAYQTGIRLLDAVTFAQLGLLPSRYRVENNFIPGPAYLFFSRDGTLLCDSHNGLYNTPHAEVWDIATKTKIDSLTILPNIADQVDQVVILHSRDFAVLSGGGRTSLVKTHILATHVEDSNLLHPPATAYPTPTDNVLSIVLDNDNTQVRYLSLMNVENGSSSVIRRDKVTVTDRTLRVLLDDFANGVYILSMCFVNGTQSQKIMINR